MLEVLTLFGLLVGLIIGVIDHYNNQPVRCSSKVKLCGKTAIVTGCSSGVGVEIAQALAERGCRVILASENLKRGERAVERIKKLTRNDNIVARYLDTSELSSVRNFVEDILQMESSLHILINSAKMKGIRDQVITADSLEKTMAVNYFGHFLLTNLLLDLLKKSTSSRVITLTSEGHRFCSSIDPNELGCNQRPFKGSFEAYGLSALCNNLFTLELSRRLQGTGVTANCIQPSPNGIEIFSKSRKKNLHSIVSQLYQLVFKDEKLESQAVDYMAVADELENTTGSYFVHFQESVPSRLSRNGNLAKAFWEESVKLVKLPVPSED